MNKGYLTFDTFLEDSSNHFASACCKAVVEHTGEYYNPLWLYGQSGCGKTHLLHAIYHALRQEKGKKALFLKSSELAEGLVDLVMNQPTVWGAVERADVLLVDNMECLRGCRVIQTDIAKLFAEKAERGQQVVCVSACVPQRLPQFFKTLQENAVQTMIADIQPPKRRLRTEFIRRRAVRMSIEITEEAVDYISRHCATLPRILGVLNSAKFNYLKDRKPIGVKEVRKYMLFGGN